MFWGIKYFNDLLNQAGPDGNVQSEILFQKDKDTFSFSEGWAFPQRVYFNGDSCVLPMPDQYPVLPNAARRNTFHSLITLMLPFLLLLFLNFGGY